MGVHGNGYRLDRWSIWNKHLGAHMIHARSILFLNTPSQSRCVDGRSEGSSAQRPSLGRRAALAEEVLVHFSSISQDHCLVDRLRALISRRHPASFIQGGHRSGVQLRSQRWPGSFRRGERPVCLSRLRGAAEMDYHRMSIAAAISSTKKTGSNTGGTSHSRTLNL